MLDSVLHTSDRLILENYHVNSQTGSEPIEIPKLSSKEAIIVHSLLKGVSLEESVQLIGNMPEEFQKDLDRISPIHSVKDLSAKVLIMHDTNDTNIPAEESRRLANAIGVNKQVYYTEFSMFDHMDPTISLDKFEWAKEIMKLLLHLNHMLKVADHPSA